MQGWKDRTNACWRPSVVALILSCQATLGAAEPQDVLKNVRLASLLGTDHVLIRSEYGLYDGVDVGQLQLIPGYPGLLNMPPDFLTRFQSEHLTNWRAGDKWKIFTGAGLPVTVLIQELVLVVMGSGAGYVSAIAQFEVQHTANRVSGLRASEFLAVPDVDQPQISEQPPMPVSDSATVAKAEELMELRGRTVVEKWQAGGENGSDDALRLDQIFLGKDPLSSQMHVYHWSPPGGKALLFAEMVCRSPDRTAVFGANAVIEEGQVLSIVDFDTRPGEQMRFSGEQANTWDDYSSVFLNAWAIGSRRFVLKSTQYYEGFSIKLMEIVPGKGLVSTGISYGDGA